MTRCPACMTSWIMLVIRVFRENNKISLVWNYLGGRELCGLRSDTLARDTDVKVSRTQKAVGLWTSIGRRQWRIRWAFKR